MMLRHVSFGRLTTPTIQMQRLICSQARKMTSSTKQPLDTGISAEQNHQIIDNVLDFAKIQSTRPDFNNTRKSVEVTKHPNPRWQYGDGVCNAVVADNHVEVDPYAPDRPMIDNYRLLISGIAPRPIGLISTLSGDGKSKNLAPMSYFQVVDHDPPMFIIGFSSRAKRVKDTYRNLRDTGECVRTKEILHSLKQSNNS